MGNYRFKLSDMMPNAWFYKLRDMGRARKQTPIQPRKKKQKQPSPASYPLSPKPKQPHQSNPRKSYYITRELNTANNRIHTSPANNQNAPPDTNSPVPPRKSSKQRSKRRSTSSPKLVTPPSVSANCSCQNNLESHSQLDNSAESESPESETRTDSFLLPTQSFHQTASRSNTCACKLHCNNNTTNDIIIDVDTNSIVREDDKLNGYRYDEYDSISKPVLLPPIVTKPAKFNDILIDAKKKETKPRTRIAPANEENVKGSLKVKISKQQQQEQRSTPGRRFSLTSSPGMKLRINSPRIGSRRFQQHGRKSFSSAGAGAGGCRRSISDSFAVVKTSCDPQRDFRESMVEMIVQNKIRTSKDLEDLLACYLSLNSDEYHDLIIKVFKQIWFDLSDNQ